MALGILNPFSPSSTSPAPVVVFSRARGGQLDNVVYMADAATDESHQVSNTITDHPVEEGANIADHSRPEPERVTITAITSNTPLNPVQQLRTIQSGSVQFQSATLENIPIGQANGYAQQAYQTLNDLRTNGVLVTVVTTLKTYFNMAIESISVPRNARNYDALEFTISFKQIRIVKNKLTRVVVAKDKRVGQRVKTGAQTPGSDQVEQSALFKMYNGGAAQKGNGTSAVISGAIGGLFQQ